MGPAKKVLVVDDEALMQDVICDLLASAGFEVTFCVDGASAISIAARQVFDIVITDYEMPGITGAQVAKCIRAYFPASIIIGVSSDDRKDDFLGAGADAFLRKPYRHRDLIAIISRK